MLTVLMMFYWNRTLFDIVKDILVIICNKVANWPFLEHSL